MNRRRLRQAALVALVTGVALFILPSVLVLFGAPVELVVVLSNLSFIAIGLAFVLLVAAAVVQVQWALTLALIALAAEVAAALFLLVREPQPAYLHPEWAWYWPVVNTLYFAGLAFALVGFLSAGIAFVSTRARPAVVAFLIAAAAVAVNRLAPYR